jgi:hypothetical protein
VGYLPVMAIRDDSHRSPNRIFALVFGAVYIFVGIAGFGVTKGIEFTAAEGNRLLIFEVNPLHNIIHLSIGLALLFAGIAGVRSSKIMNGVIGAGYLGVGLYGLAVAGENTDANFLALNQADNFLHLGTAIIALAIALTADREVREPDVRDQPIRSPRAKQHN